jgi:diacylglycerol kinase (ATP)
MTTCVIYNPAAGRGRAERLLQEFRKTVGAEIELRPTAHEGHAVELSTRAAKEGFAKVVAAGGDGTVHEVANGILASGRQDVVFSVWPIGSANDYAYSLGMIEWWKHRQAAPPTDVMDVDVGRVIAQGLERYFVCNLGVGFNGMVNGEARKTRWLAGMPLYAWAFLKSMVRHFARPVMTIRFDGEEVTAPTLALSVLNGQREGNFPLRPGASLTDGLFDYMHATRLSRGHLIRYLPAMATGRLPENHKLLRLGRARRIVVRSETPLCVHADGEFVCVPEEGIRQIEVEVMPRRLRVEVYLPALYGGRGEQTKSPPTAGGL